MVTRRHGQIVETPTEARLAEPGPLGARAFDGVHRARGIDPRRGLVRVLSGPERRSRGEAGSGGDDRAKHRKPSQAGGRRLPAVGRLE